MLTRYQAADIAKFTDATTHAFAFGPQDGYIYYAVEVDILADDGASIKHACVTCFKSKQYSQSEVSESITQLWVELVQGGFIGNTKLPHQPLKNGITLTGNPLDDMIQVSNARANPRSN